MARKASSGEAVGVGVTITLMLALIYEMRPRDEQRAPLSTPAVAARHLPVGVLPGSMGTAR